ncbi:MAG: WecB/TagA/CpsF family glycosyltransferase [Candidatus Thiodiazotropha sp. (ex Cardiolucina cf. quadrata)]|nr:WecB/TagA/CpsF family glycosyltransferase [Candidatus Thiodiazotropha sp. (ex Cardiolucina cf. quadrata)]
MSKIRGPFLISPPFRELNKLEDTGFVDKINSTEVQILFVGLGCPKQEKWMAQHKGEVHAVMVGVGAVFDFLSGTKKEAPRWLQSLGLEWLFRLLSEPNRLWKRYTIHNPRFIWHFFKQLLSN